MLKLKGEVYFLTTEEGGLLRPPFDGMRPSFSIKGKLITSEMTFANKAEKYELGRQYSVEIALPYGEIYSSDIKAGLKFRLQVGGKLVARGEVVANSGDA